MGTTKGSFHTKSTTILESSTWDPSQIYFKFHHKPFLQRKQSPENFLETATAQIKSKPQPILHSDFQMKARKELTLGVLATTDREDFSREHPSKTTPLTAKVTSLQPRLPPNTATILVEKVYVFLKQYFVLTKCCCVLYILQFWGCSRSMSRFGSW